MRRRWGGFSTAAPPSLLCTRISPHHHHQAASTTTTQLTITHLKEQTKIILTSTCSKTHSGLNPINHALLIFLVFERLYRPENALISCFLHSYGHHLDESWWMFSALMREKDKSSHCSYHARAFINILNFNCVTPDCFSVLMEKFAKVVKWNFLSDFQTLWPSEYYRC